MINKRKIINTRIKLLENSSFDFESFFEVIHSDPKERFAEVDLGYDTVYYTYGEFKQLVYKYATYFKSTISVDQEFVGLMMENSIEWLASFWGLLAAGFKPMLINLRLTKNLNNEILKRLNIKYIISDKIYDLDGFYIDVTKIDFDEIKEETQFTWANEIALSSSATSLNYKICIYDGSAICEQVENTKQLVKENAMIKGFYHGYLKQLCFLPFYHIFGLMACYFWFSFFGRCFVFLPNYNPDTLLYTIKKHEVTHIFAVPLLWNTIYKEIVTEVYKKDEKTIKKYEKGIKLSIKLQSAFPYLGKAIASKLFNEIRSKTLGDSIKFLIAGGSFINEDTLKTINAIGYPLYVGYGMTEVGITSVELRTKLSKRIQGSVGHPLSKVSYKINTDNVLEVKSSGICKAIYTKDETVIINKDEYFNTGDVAKEVKGYYFINGRSDDIVLAQNGEKINPDLIEKGLSLLCPKNYTIVDILSNDYHYLSLVLEIDYNLNQIKINNLLEELDTKLSMLNDQGYHIDKVYYTFNPIKAPTAIKVSRSYFKKMYEAGSIELHNISSLKDQLNISFNDLEKDLIERVKKIFIEVLNIEEDSISLNDNFIFDLGGTSLDYLALISKLKDEFDLNVESDLTDEVSLYTILDFVKLIEKKINEKN